MKKLLFLLLILNVKLITAQELKFNNSGQFKIIQFTDIHYKIDQEDSNASIAMMNSTLDNEKPDLVVFTGDIITSKQQAKKSWDNILNVVISRNIPYMVTLGNHDDEGDLKRKEIADYLSTKKMLVNKTSVIENVAGVMNAAISVKDRNNSKAAAVLYIMDSHAYSSIPKVKGYGWFQNSQIEWFKKESKKYKEGIKDTLPALAFFHIPLPEYSLAFNDMRNKRIGVRYEAECAPSINTGMYAAMLESGDVMGTFVGHDHVNDYLVDYYGIALAYGCFSGSSTTYQRSKSGARIIILKEGKRSFDTYIRENDGNIVYQTSFPFVK